MNSIVTRTIVITAIIALVIGFVGGFEWQNLHLNASGGSGGVSTGLAVIVGPYGGETDPRFKADGALQATEVVYNDPILKDCPKVNGEYSPYTPIRPGIVPFNTKNEAQSLKLSGDPGLNGKFHPVKNPGFPNSVKVGSSHIYQVQLSPDGLAIIAYVTKSVDRLLALPPQFHTPNVGKFGGGLGGLGGLLGGDNKKGALYPLAKNVVGKTLQDGDHIDANDIVLCVKPGYKGLSGGGGS